MNNGTTSTLYSGGPDPQSQPRYSIPMFGRGTSQRPSRVTFNAGASYGQSATIPTPTLGAVSSDAGVGSSFAQEQRQQSMANAGQVPRGPSPGFASMQRGKIARGDTSALNPDSLPQFDPTGGQHQRQVDDLEAIRPVLGGSRTLAGTSGGAGGMTSPAPMNTTQFYEAVAHARGEGPAALSTEEAAKLVRQEEQQRLAAATQPSTPSPTPPANQAPPVPPMLGTAARPRLQPGEVNPATGKTADQAAAANRSFQPNPGSIHPSEQNARSIWQHFVEQNGQNYGEAEKQFIAHMQSTYGVDGSALINQWKQQGNELQFQFAQPGQTQPAVATPTMSRAQGQQLLGTGEVQSGAAGAKPLLVTQPDGQTVMVDEHGQRVGPVVTQGQPLPPRPVMGPQPGYTPAPQSSGVAGAPTPVLGGTPTAAAPAAPANPYAAFVQNLGGGAVAGETAAAPTSTSPPLPVLQPTANGGYAIATPPGATLRVSDAPAAPPTPSPTTAPTAPAARATPGASPAGATASLKPLPQSMVAALKKSSGNDLQKAKRLAIQQGFDPDNIDNTR